MEAGSEVLNPTTKIPFHKCNPSAPLQCSKSRKHPEHVEVNAVFPQWFGAERQVNVMRYFGILETHRYGGYIRQLILLGKHLLTDPLLVSQLNVGPAF